METIRRLTALDTVVLFLPPDTDAARTFLDKAAAATLLIDRAGIVRRVLTGRVLAGADLEQFVELWQSGKTYFIAYCARCHGEEGDSTICMEKPLTGVGTRMSAEQLRESLRIGDLGPSEVLIRGERIKRFQLDAILVYVSGL